MLPLAVRPTRRDRAWRVLGPWRMFRVGWMLRVVRLGRLVAALFVAHLFLASLRQPCTAWKAPSERPRASADETRSSLQASMRPVRRRRGCCVVVASLTGTALSGYNHDRPTWSNPAWVRPPGAEGPRTPTPRFISPTLYVPPKSWA